MKTIGVSDTTHTKLKRYCENNDINQGEFVENALKYFEKNGIHPVKHESPAAEMIKLIKRIDQVVAFIRNQEIKFLRPMIESVNISETRIQQQLASLATSESLDEYSEMVSNVVENSTKLYQRMDGEFMRQFKQQQELLKEQGIQLKVQQEQHKKAFEYLGKLIDAKDLSNFVKDIGSVYNKINTLPK